MATRNLWSRPKHNMWLRKAGKRERQINVLSRIRIAKRQPTSLQSNSHEKLKKWFCTWGNQNNSYVLTSFFKKLANFFFYIGALSICSETVFYPALQPAHALVNTGFRTSARLRRRQLYLNIKKKSVTRRRKNVSPVYGLFTTGIRWIFIRLWETAHLPLP